MFKPLTVLTLFAGIVAADVAVAQTTKIDLPVRVQKGESYQGLLARASKLAENTIERRFQGNSQSDRVNLIVTAEKEGEIAPLLSVNVSRQDWRGNPNLQRWANVFPFGKDLLGFGTPPLPAETPPAETPPVATPPTTTQPTPVPIDLIPEDPASPIPLPNQRLRPTPPNLSP
jgi:hypothetical protein